MNKKKVRRALLVCVLVLWAYPGVYVGLRVCRVLVHQIEWRGEVSEEFRQRIELEFGGMTFEEMSASSDFTLEGKRRQRLHESFSPQVFVSTEFHDIGCGLAGNPVGSGERLLLAFLSPLVELEMFARGFGSGEADIVVEMPTGERGIDQSFVTQRFHAHRKISRRDSSRPNEDW